jgi:hypothetical protein
VREKDEFSLRDLNSFSRLIFLGEVTAILEGRIVPFYFSFYIFSFCIILIFILQRSNQERVNENEKDRNNK